MNVHIKKTVPVEYKDVLDAYLKIRRGGKATGIDNESWTEFEKNVEKNLYVIWNRIASGSYHPQGVREVEIPKKDGKTRKLGIPTLRDRIAQQVVKRHMERKIDHIFHENSYGYRPMKSAHQALEKVKENCNRYDWVLDMDISKFFDEIDHELMLKAVEHVMEEKWVSMYVKRWLESPMVKADGSIEERNGKGTPQGGVISPLLANLYLHFTLDVWLSKNFPHLSFVRYADDIIIHCRNKTQAEKALTAIKERLKEVKLAIKEEKTRIAYCKDYRRKENHENVKFEFLGFSYQPRPRKSKYTEKTFMAFSAEISQSSQKKIRDVISGEDILRNTHLPLKVLAKSVNARVRGWINYFGLYSKRKLRQVLIHLDNRLISLMRKKYHLGKREAISKLRMIRQENPALFYHWATGYCYF
jgi:group II intron reverse transcriptase/maturase